MYRAMLLHQEHDHVRLAGRLDLTEQQVFAAVDRLISLSLLKPSWDEPGMVRAVSPELGLELLLQREEQELALRQERIAQTRATPAMLAAEYASADSAAAPSRAGTELLDGMDEIRTRLETLASRCTQEALSFQPGGVLPTEAVEAGQPLNEQAILRGVKFRSLYLHSIVKDRVTVAYVKWAAEHGSEIRLAPTLPVRLLIVDRHLAVIPGDHPAPRPTAVVIHTPPVVRALLALFDAYWKDAEPLEPDTDQFVPGEPTAQEREMLRMLAAGDKDETVARALGISVRTERRMVADITARLGASSRLELGVKAAKLGWV
ncbi:helix-turn-helix transcriptional regulator [Streptomyces sp. NPDC003710]